MKYQLKTKIRKIKKYEDARFVNQWPDKVLVERYVEAKQKLTELENQMSKFGLVGQKKKEDLAKKHKKLLCLKKVLKKEGEKRQILYFLPWEEVEAICKRIFWGKRKYKLVSRGDTPQA